MFLTVFTLFIAITKFVPKAEMQLRNDGFWGLVLAVLT
ncbi:hypothetical protein N474_08845 [Pseudoalteromonas luteoviolacea CPMOR-2]|uniref:Uncharacterized protein n=1 Tax=Pseudoalteromonas luteoviolacea DSM 6061 TaxID=1365250 RepID=A0A166XHN5_9GAMM|nr:hypothetical protein N475_12775 [Pseudoalteromonas luteoviolacea DSM 6061]KZN57298.1 hypothetical protein N474_08845 [Pseudoalteromonas luteoviolacea CPMOR-2]MBE0387884.1 hypothetical protein [Pseudoalteromonas luteoviolacea DSM 6061]